MKTLKYNIKESLIKSYDYKKLQNKILNKFKDKIIEIHEINSKSKNNKSFSILFDEKYINDIIYDESLYKLIDLFGFYITELNYVKDDKQYIVRFEPIFGDKCNNIVYNECNGIIYHITKPNIINSIFKKGLLPIIGTTYRNFTARVFFSCGRNNEEIINNINDLKKSIFGKNKEYHIIRINLNKHKYNVDFYYDPSGDNKHNYIYANAIFFPHMIESIGNINDLKETLKKDNHIQESLINLPNGQKINIKTI